MPETNPKEYYLLLRRDYTPERIKLIIIAESPPESGKYFYNPEGLSSEPLFSALMQQLDLSRPTKQDGLRVFQRRGWLLIDATYEPVDKHAGSRRYMTISKRNAVICRDYPQLRADLERLTFDRSVPLILIKANVCRFLEPKLVEDKFNVLNRGRDVYFPSNGRQTKFREQFGAIVKETGL